MIPNIHYYMTYEEFLERYLVNHEEFMFYYKDKIVNICYAGPEGGFEYNICLTGQRIFYRVYRSPQELLDNMEIDGVKFPELWDLLE